MSSIRRRMKARIKISLISASLATSDRSVSAPSSRNSPGSVTRPRTNERCPEIIVISPVNSPGPWLTMGRSPSRLGCTISMLPDSTTKNRMPVSLGSKRISPCCTFRTRPKGRIRSICAEVRTGKAWLRASRKDNEGSEDDMLHLLTLVQGSGAAPVARRWKREHQEIPDLNSR